MSVEDPDYPDNTFNFTPTTIYTITYILSSTGNNTIEQKYG